MIGKITSTTFSGITRSWYWPQLGLTLGLMWLGAAGAAPTLAAEPPQFDLEQFQQGLCPNLIPGVSEVSHSPTDLTLPSLWWIQDQLSASQFSNRLLEKWLACPAQGKTARRVDVLVNTQAWTLLDYWERYEFVHRLGSVAAGYGYTLRVLNRQQAVLAAYSCQVNSALAERPNGESGNRQEVATQPILGDGEGAREQRSVGVETAGAGSCLTLDSVSQGGFRGRSPALDGSFPTAPGTAPP
jgi:hypothetical protein